MLLLQSTQAVFECTRWKAEASDSTLQELQHVNGRQGAVCRTGDLQQMKRLVLLPAHAQSPLTDSNGPTTFCRKLAVPD